MNTAASHRLRPFAKTRLAKIYRIKKPAGTSIDILRGPRTVEFFFHFALVLTIRPKGWKINIVTLLITVRSNMIIDVACKPVKKHQASTCVIIIVQLCVPACMGVRAVGLWERRNSYG